MRKLTTALFTLIAAVGLAHAGGSDDEAARKAAQQHAAKRISVDLRQATDGQFRAVHVAATAATCDSSTPEVVIHDDGEAENGTGWVASANVGRLADKFTPALYPATVGTVCASFITLADVDTFNFTIAVYDDDGADGAPGTLLGSKAFVAHPVLVEGDDFPFTASFESFDLSSLNLDIPSGSVYVSIEWDAAAEPAGVFLSTDESTSTPGAGGYYSADGDPWAPMAGDPGFGSIRALMVRATMPNTGPGAPVLTKAFAPTQIMAGETSTLTITLNNGSQSTAAVLNADLVDTFPAGLIVAPTPNADTTCPSGTATAVASGMSVTLNSGAEIPANGSCTVSVDVTSSTDGAYENAIAAEALQTTNGNNADPAEAALQVGYIFPAPYCSKDFPDDIEPITRVMFDGIDNHSDGVVNGSPALENFTDVIGTVTAATTVSMTVEGNTNGDWTTVIQAYIDWNQDGSFDEGTEGYYIGDLINSTGADGKQVVADIAIPATALPGNTRMRVTKKYGSAAEPCGSDSLGYGQAEDYTITVAPPVIHTVTPSVGTGSGSIDPATAQSVYDNATATFALTPDPDFVVDTVGGSCGGILTGGSFVTAPVTADCTVVANFKVANPFVSKAFEPATIGEGGSSTAIITLSNPTSADATLTAALVDTLPSGLSATSATTSCGLLARGSSPSALETTATSITLPSGTVLPAGSTCEIRATVEPAGAGSYVNTIPVDGLQTSQGNNARAAEATLTVTGTPVIAVTPTDLSVTLTTNNTTSDTLTIGNSGTGDLEYSIGESPAAKLNPPSFRNITIPAGQVADTAILGRDTGHSSGRSGITVVLDEAGIPISQMDDNTPGDEGVSCGVTSTSTADNSWWRRFYFSEYPQVGGSAAVTSVTISTGSDEIPGGLPTTINLYTVPHSAAMDTIPTGSLTLIGSTTTTVSGSLASITIPVSGIVDDTTGLDLVVEWHTDGNASGGQFFPGANTTPETHPTFMSSSTCGIDAPTTATDVGFPDFHLTMVVNLSAANCQGLSDIPWLSVDPSSGSVAVGGADANVDVTFNADGVGPGTYDANVCVLSNDPTHPVVRVPVSMTVEPSGNHFTVTPSVGDGTGTISPDTAQSVDENGSFVFTLTPGPKQQVADVGGTCGGTLDGNTFTTDPVTEDCTVVANFEPLPFPLPYCSVDVDFDVEPISRVVLRDIDNRSDPVVNASPVLENFLAVVGGNVSQGGLYDIAVEGNTAGTFTNKVNVYIDWNQDGDFTGAGESYSLSDLVNSDGTDGQQAAGNIQVPANALLGATRMRVIKQYSAAAAACGPVSYGQAEDYTIIVDDNPLPLPAANVSPGFLSLTAPQGTHLPSTDSAAVTVSNEGEGRLTFTVKRALAEDRGVSRSALAKSAELAQARRNDAARAARLGIPYSPLQNNVITALAKGGMFARGSAVLANDPQCNVGAPGLVVHDGDADPDDGFGWNDSAGTDTKIVDKFTPTAYPATYTTVCVSLLTVGSYTEAPVKIVVFADDGPDGAPGTELGSMDVTASNITNDIFNGIQQSFQAFDISEMGLAIDSGSVYIGVGWDATAYPDLYLAADLTSDADAGGYAYAGGDWYSAIDLWEDYKSMFVRAVEAAAGPPGVGCDNPSNVRWLSATPTSGLIDGLGSMDVTVTADASGLDVGTHEGLLCIDTNDPVHPRFEISVSFDVTPAADNDIIFQDGFDGQSAGEPGVFTDHDAFLDAITSAYYEEDFATVPGGLVTAPLSFTGAGAGYSVFSSSTYDADTNQGGLFNPTGAISVNSGNNRIVVTIASGSVMAIGGNFWASNAAFEPSGTTITLTLSDGTTESYTSTGPDDFRGFITTQPITKIEVDAPDAGNNASWPVMDNLVIGSAN